MADLGGFEGWFTQNIATVRESVDTKLKKIVICQNNDSLWDGHSIKIGNQWVILQYCQKYVWTQQQRNSIVWLLVLISKYN